MLYVYVILNTPAVICGSEIISHSPNGHIESTRFLIYILKVTQLVMCDHCLTKHSYITPIYTEIVYLLYCNPIRLFL